MHKLSLLLILSSLLLAKEYMGIIEPIQTYTIYAQTSGEVIKLDTNKETSIIDGVLLQIDARDETNTLQALNNQYTIYTKLLAIKKRAFDNAEKIKQKSQTQKDQLEIALLELEYKISELSRQIKALKLTMEHKSITANKLYLKEYLVNLHDYVTPGKAVATLYDTSKARIVVYVHHDELSDLENKSVWIDAKESSARIVKIDATPDITYASSHKVELQLDSKQFGKVVTVDFK